MIEYRYHHISIMVLYAVMLHLWWAMMIILDEAALNVTGIAALHKYLQSPGILTITVASASMLAMIGIFTRRPWYVFLLLPQQILLMMSAAGATEAIWLAQFADGVTRPRAFIAADQVYSIIGAIGHTAAIVFHALRVGRERPNNDS